VVFDDAEPRANIFGANQTADVNALQWGSSAATRYGANVENGAADFYTLAVDAGGASLVSDVKSVLFANQRIQFANGLIYADSGQVFDPASGNLVGSFALNAAAVMTVDTGANVAYFAYLDSISGVLTVRAFDATRLTPLRLITLATLTGKPTRLVRFGTQGLAIALKSGAVVLLTGSFVTG
jgi:hypothetical protein